MASDPRRNGQLTAQDVDNHKALAADLTRVLEKINPSCYARELGGLIEVHGGDATVAGVLLACLLPQEAATGLHLLELLIHGG